MPIEAKRIALPEFKTMAADAATGGTAAVAGFCIAKGFASEVKAVEGDDRVREFIASTGDVDRDGDTVAADGWDLTSFLKAGVFLWAHSRELAPIATPIATWVEGSALKIRVKFAPADMPHQYGVGFGDAVRRMYDEKLLKGVSVGFIPKEWTFNEERGGTFMPMDFKRQELLEVSAAPVISNPNALHVARSKGINVAPLIAWAETVRDDKTGLWLPKAAAAELLEQAAGAKTISIPAAPKAEPAKTEAAPEATKAVEPAADSIKLKAPIEIHIGGEANAADIMDAVRAVAAREPPAPAPEPEPTDYEKAVAAAEVAEAGVVSKIKQAAAIIAKSGRVLSKKNEDDLRAASDLILAVLAQVNPPDEDDDKAAKAAGAGITPTEIKAMIDAALDNQISKLTGRLPR